MPFVEYSGEIIPSDKKSSSFEKDKDGFKVATQDDLKQQVGNDWWHLPATAIGSAGLGAAGKAVWDWYTSKSKPEGTRIEPVLNEPPPPPAPAALESPAPSVQQLQQRAAEIKAATQPAAPVQPPALAAPVAIEAPAAPSAAEAVATGQSPSKAVQMDVAKQLDEASGVTNRVRRTKAQIEQAMKEAFAKAPEGMLPSAPAKTNKWPGDVIGQGGWHWFEGQGGTPEEWTRLYGRTNQPYQRVVTDVKGGVLGVPPKPEGAKGGTVPRQEHVPEYIKGAASPAMLLNVAANALGVAGLANAYKEGKKTGDWSNLGLGVIDQILSNVAPKAGLGLSLMAPTELAPGTVRPIPKTKEEREKQYAERVGGGRGIVPASMYQR